jgi:hypothetical protein
MTREEQIRLGDVAAHLLDDPIVREVFQRMEEAYVAALRATQPADEVGREGHYYALRALDDFRRHLKVIADTGTFERAHLERAVKSTKKG